MTKLHLRKAADTRGEQVQDARGEFRNVACACMDDVRKARDQPEIGRSSGSCQFEFSDRGKSSIKQIRFLSDMSS